MHGHDAPQIARSQEQKRGVPPKHSRIPKLHDASQQRWRQRSERVGERVLIEMVDVRDAKV